ncbi:MAG: malto-oligosyltrehalose trehalohydrolase [Anaerolineae bacterium]|nr:malto-oligosyltrehalose trehalohydrolase [Anaerolineae bacterium]
MSQLWEPKLGAICLGNNTCKFRVWAPNADTVDLRLLAPQERTIPMEHDAEGYFQVTADDVPPGCLYLYRLNGEHQRPDPASRYQPQGVHGPSQVVDPQTAWDDANWSGLPLTDYIFYELHVGTFTSEGTFTAIIPFLDELRDMGITALEIMPVAQFPGKRNWGYDGVYPFAVQESYGGPDGLRQLVNACHQRGLAVVLDVVYNHLGPEGNYLGEYGPYFTDRYKTPWGTSINFDGPHSDHVRRYFIENALYWITDFHIDALRLDATHAILDFSAYTFLEDLVDTVHQQADILHRRVYLIAENDRNDARIVRPREIGGYGLDAQWSDDLHHALHTLLTSENAGYYQDFGALRHLAKALREGFVYTGDYSPFRQRRHGVSSKDVPASRLVICAQNHDQVGNRMLGERLGHIASFEELKLAAGTVLLSPYLPLLFMGEEYGETAPFLYFVDHSDQVLIEAVRSGRREEFAAFHHEGEPPDPFAEETFAHSKLDHDLQRKSHHYVLREFYRELINLRKTLPALRNPSKDTMEIVAYEKPMVLFVRRWSADAEAFMAFNFADEGTTICLPVPTGRWRRQIDSTDTRWRAGIPAGAYAEPAPDLLLSEGELTLPLSQNAFILYARES